VAPLDPSPPRCPPPLALGGQRLLLPGRAQVEVVLQQLPLQLAALIFDQFLQLIVRHLPGPATGKVPRQRLKAQP
jgi:hypothetical protein